MTATTDRAERIVAAIRDARDALSLAAQMELQDRRHGDRGGTSPLMQGRIDGLTHALEIAGKLAADE